MRAASAAAAQGATPTAIDSTLSKLEDPRTGERLIDIVTSPEMRTAVSELSSNVNAGVVVKGIDTGPVSAQLSLLLGNLLQSFLQNLEKAAPALHRMVVDEVGSALPELMRDSVAPALASMLSSPAVQSSIALTAREAAHQAVLGSSDGLAELADRKSRERGALGAVDQLFEKRTWLAALLVAVLVLGGPTLWLLRELTKIRRALEGGGVAAARELKRAVRNRQRARRAERTAGEARTAAV